MQFGWLKDYKRLQEHLVYLKWNLNKSKLELIRWVEGDLVNVRLEKNSRSSYLEENIEKMEQEIEIIERQKEEMILLIGTFTGVDNQIIRLKYISGMTLEEIAYELGYSVSYIQKRHAEIKRTIHLSDEYDKARLKNQKYNN